MKYRLLPQAAVDLEGLGDYIASHNPNAAVRFVDALERRWNLLTLHPFSGAPREDIAPGIRHLVVGEYLTLYRVTDDAIEILRVLHGHRKIEADDLGP
ncbi:type II toxin-antitoxin system RelE/ParE family toxin [Mesorhizobium sp. B2-3-5]|uniref:type II toxin-antitoxin system RelE/ParE family toxin n=1 Tax=Mesorhizobium sp. B2-3-5 TaxID=2589958 RepID=UPI00112EE6F7|nr:type II toxin-antitoxin system RelE/ParE family toxin [Mesorhizobium sp. B2-3-5]TPM30747.1 type II toxin-antitoxin system RelE/ParE family toxin [Mesorhizobium sp. B2-3-5]